MNGIVAYGAYVPFARLDRKAIAEALGVAAGSGTRVVASYDEDVTSMAVEAARAALRQTTVVPEAVCFATASPPYLDKTNATAIHAALDLPHTARAYDMTGSIRSGAGAFWAALNAPGSALALMADIRTGLPGGGDERDGGDAAAAFLCGPSSDAMAVPVAMASASAEFLERWRVPGDTASRQWEERFGEQVYVSLAEAPMKEAFAQAGVAPDRVDRLIVAGPHGRANRRVAGAAAAFGMKEDAVADDLAGVVGNTGTAHAGLLLADALDRAAADQTIVVLSLADGADVTIWRTTAALAARKPRRTVASEIAGGRSIPYATFLTWRGFLTREPPRRPDPQSPAGPPSYRAEAWKFAFIGSRCDACGARQVPPQRVCVKCQAVDRMTRERMADVPATVATSTVDRLAYSLSPPVVAAVIDFDGGGRFQCELTDVDPAKVKIGDRVEMTFRRLYTANGIHNYFWKARPVR
ncbi:MAG: hydroxymethylglutaryl-CoA synthase family protein [Candidatus Rokubacteria bacterium]|nr:hydroxymethylglutaryl-CoA synthase family protein [Candidatus Rokubacteria bacterium]